MGKKARVSLYWKIRRLGYIFWLPIGGAILLGAWVLIPQWETNYQQRALADAFFAECKKGFDDTSTVPRIPEGALHEAERVRALTVSALISWAPQVSGLVRDGNYVARIEFKNPKDLVIEQKIGVSSEPSTSDQ
jgi:hypothetical protein